MTTPFSFLPKVSVPSRMFCGETLCHAGLTLFRTILVGGGVPGFACLVHRGHLDLRKFSIAIRISFGEALFGTRRTVCSIDNPVAIDIHTLESGGRMRRGFSTGHVAVGAGFAHWALRHHRASSQCGCGDGNCENGLFHDALQNWGELRGPVGEGRNIEVPPQLMQTLLGCNCRSIIPQIDRIVTKCLSADAPFMSPQS